MAIYRLRGCVQHYAWGGNQFLPKLLKSDNPDGKPWAEYWLGIHPKGPAQVLLPEGEKSLADFLAHLPFLLKVLDVQSMLSIQLHPNREQAQAGFLREEKLGIPRLAANRSYKDENHKPELMVALTDFWLLHGFRPVDEIEQTLVSVPAWRALQDVLLNEGLLALYRTVMEAPQQQVDQWLGPLYADLRKGGDWAIDQVEYWVWQAFEQYTRDGHFDRGIFSIYWFNLLHLKAGEGIFQAAGVPHAYLRGVNVELMANSDNVLRGGLTPKHIDVTELLGNIYAEPICPKRITAVARTSGTLEYPVPVPDFRLYRTTVMVGQQIDLQYPEAAISILLTGEATIDGEYYSSGEAFLLLANQTATLNNSGPEPTVLYTATF